MMNPRHIDRLIAVHVFGMDLTDKDGFEYKISIPPYSTNIEQAWKIVNHFSKFSAVSEFKLVQDYEGLWQCVLSGAGESVYLGKSYNQDNVCMVICMAALHALSIDIPQTI